MRTRFLNQRKPSWPRDRKRKAMEYGWGGYASTDFRIVPSEKVYQIFLRQHVPSSYDFGIYQIGEAYKLVKHQFSYPLATQVPP
jgi:hypothetical protein